ncbi:MAG: hypothetical protein VXZ36_15035 [Pseudomonadota bacterium]|nr:hypothetical protein [Pseudomonadota bacterium]
MKLASMLFLGLFSLNSFASIIYKFDFDKISAVNDQNQLVWDFSGYLSYNAKSDVNTLNFSDLFFTLNIYDFGGQSTSYDISYTDYMGDGWFEQGDLYVENLIDGVFGNSAGEGFGFEFVNDTANDLYYFDTGIFLPDNSTNDTCLTFGSDVVCAGSLISVNVPDEYYAQVSAPATMSMFFLVAIGLVLRRMRDE